MKPLLEKELPSFLQRFDNFKEAEFRSLEMISPTQISITFATQDNARAFDRVTIKLEFTNVTDAKLLQESKISLINISDGISIIYNNNKFAFTIAECYNISDIKNTTLYIISDSLKFQEGIF